MATITTQLKGIKEGADKMLTTVEGLTTVVGQTVNPSGTKVGQLRTGAILGAIAAGAVAGLFLAILVTSYDNDDMTQVPEKKE